MISAVILTKNEEKNIMPCIQGIMWCDEVIVIDDNSTDKTVAIAKQAGAVVYTRSLENDFSSQRNFGLQKAKGDWIFFVDADERVSLSLSYEIQTKITRQIDHIDGYIVKRLDTLWGKQVTHGEIGNTRLLRLGRKDAGRWKGTVHEIWDIKHTQQLQNSLEHFPHQTVVEFLQEINVYTSLRAHELHLEKKTISASDIILYPAAKFMLNYVFRLGFLDGIQGLLVANFMSLHSFLVRAKLWQKNL